ncbi:MAG: hypothetical protein IT368_12150, partial [Candidatus Hydrogenedentes bacterium]|nr:hypothetical protein [Candidatus Hydrogenedentota bacterium]
IQLEGPWVDRPFGLPILVRDPYGKTHLSRDARGEGPRRTYYFDLSGGGALTWLEVVTPEGRRRITLGPDHSWNGD